MLPRRELRDEKAIRGQSHQQVYPAEAEDEAEADERNPDPQGSVP